jgi:predicted nucleic acid-binding protein
VRQAVLDASALLALYNNTRGADKVAGLLKDALHGETHVIMSAVNWGEVHYITWRDRGQQAAQKKMSELRNLPIEIEPADFETAAIAAEMKASFPLPYVDCFVASVARRRKATLVTLDRDFAVLRHQVSILFL